jgi:hypothetical protein
LQKATQPISDTILTDKATARALGWRRKGRRVGEKVGNTYKIEDASKQDKQLAMTHGVESLNHPSNSEVIARLVPGDR